MSRKIRSIDKDALNALCAYSWPGNIRELRNVLERAVILCQGQVVTTGSLTLPVDAPQGKPESLTLNEVEPSISGTYYASSGNNRTKAAKLLGIVPFHS